MEIKITWVIVLKSTIKYLAILISAIVTTGVVGSVFALMIEGYHKIRLERGFDLFPSFALSNSTLFSVFGTIFGGVVAAIAIYIAFTQANNLHIKTIKNTAKEQYFERRIRELSKVSDIVANFLAKAIALHTFDNVCKVPATEDEIFQRKNAIYELYHFLERNYTELFLTEVLFDYCSNCEANCILSVLEKKLGESQKDFADQYRKMYKYIHAFLSFYDEKNASLYCREEGWIWEIKQQREEDRMQAPPVQTIDENRMPTWLHYDHILMEMNQAMIPAAKEQEQYLSNIIAMAIETRSSFVVFSQNFKLFEQEILDNPEAKPRKLFCKTDRLEAYKNYCAAKSPV